MANEEESFSREIALLATNLLNEKKGLDPVLLEVSEVTYLADYFLICSGTSAQQVHTLADHLMEGLEKEGFTLFRLEGYREGRWVLLDYGDLVVHIFQPEEREFYNLERLWGQASTVSLSAEN